MSINEIHPSACVQIVPDEAHSLVDQPGVIQIYSIRLRQARNNQSDTWPFSIQMLAELN
jgi:hypothetical protein